MTYIYMSYKLYTSMLEFWTAICRPIRRFEISPFPIDRVRRQDSEDHDREIARGNLGTKIGNDEYHIIWSIWYEREP